MKKIILLVITMSCLMVGCGESNIQQEGLSDPNETILTETILTENVIIENEIEE